MVHLDSTTLSLHGTYDAFDDHASPKPLVGYSKDHRPDLKQVTLQCVSLGKSALPIWIEALDGNSSDKKSFPETVKRVNKFYQQIKAAPKMCFVADSALYGNTLCELDVDWLTRVPENYSDARLLRDGRDIEWTQSQDMRYKFLSYTPQNKQERWLLIRSEPAFNRENETFLRKHAKMFDELQKSLWHLSCQQFNCEKDAKKAIEKIIFSKKHFYNIAYEVVALPRYNSKARPSKHQEPDGFLYQIKLIGVASDLTQINKKRETLGRFILATNVLDQNILSNEAMLTDYKDQSQIERGFRFIKMIRLA